MNGSNPPRNVLQFRWLGRELLIAVARTAILADLAWFAAREAARTADPTDRALGWPLPLLIIADLLGSHWYDVPTVDPRYWTEPPESVARLKADPGLIRVFGKADKSADEPGYVSEEIDFFEVRDQLDWSLPVVWKLNGARGETPIIPQRHLDYTDHAKLGNGRFDIESVTHVLTGREAPTRSRALPARHLSIATARHCRGCGWRVSPLYAKDVAEATPS